MGRNQKLGATKGQSRPRKLYDDSDDEKLDLKIDSITQKIHTPAFMYVLTFFASLGGFLFGYDTGVISGAMIKLRNEFGLTYFWQELVVSVTLGTAAVFALVGGCLNDRLGRRAVILASCVIFTVGAICMGVAVDKYMLLAGRVVVGAAIGRFGKKRSSYISIHVFISLALNAPIATKVVCFSHLLKC